MTATRMGGLFMSQRNVAATLKKLRGNSKRLPCRRSGPSLNRVSPDPPNRPGFFHFEGCRAAARTSLKTTRLPDWGSLESQKTTSTAYRANRRFSHATIPSPKPSRATVPPPSGTTLTLIAARPFSAKVLASRKINAKLYSPLTFGLKDK